MAAQKVVVEGSSVTALQLKDMFRQFADGSLNGDHAQAFIEHRNPFGEKAAPEKAKVLKALDNALVGPLALPFDPKKFFKTREGLWVSDDLKSRVLKHATIAEPTDAVQLKRFDLIQSVYDREIKAALPQEHEVQLWQIAKMIEAQQGGTDGPLLNNGYWNIFYI